MTAAVRFPLRLASSIDSTRSLSLERIGEVTDGDTFDDRDR